MANILTIKEKIMTFLNERNIKKVDFFEATGIQPSNFKGKNMSSQPGGDMLVKILTVYPDLSAEWLMRGEGDMFKTNIPNTNSINFEQINKNSNFPPEITDKFLITIKEQAEEIGALKQTIKQLRKELGDTASAVPTSGTANVG